MADADLIFSFADLDESSFFEKGVGQNAKCSFVRRQRHNFHGLELWQEASRLYGLCHLSDRRQGQRGGVAESRGFRGRQDPSRTEDNGVPRSEILLERSLRAVSRRKDR